jgi:hypothetical protein
MLAIVAALNLATPNSPALGSILPPPASPCRTIAARTQGLDRSHRFGTFQIHYAVSGPDAIGEQKDINGNGTPDVIDDLAQQLGTANDYYIRVLGLTSPLSQPRYRQVEKIQVLVRNMREKTGLSFDEAVREPGQKNCELLIVVSARLEFDRNPTAAHELFHLFQYGYAMFKAPWYLEGMARWIERVFVAPGDTGRQSVRAPVRCQSVLQEGYTASRFWRSAALVALSAPPAPPNRRLLKSRYVNSRRVIADDNFPGDIIQFVLKRLQKLSMQLSGDHLPAFDWPESVQKSHRFDRQMCQSIHTALNEVPSRAQPARRTDYKRRREEHD